MLPPDRSLLRWLPSLATAGGMLMAGAPHGLTDRAWWTAAVFAATIVGFVARPLPMGAVCLIGITTVILTGTLEPEVALSGFSNSVIWLIVTAFLISRAVVKSGLGSRIALFFVSRIGSRILGVSYAMALTDLILAPRRTCPADFNGDGKPDLAVIAADRPVSAAGVFTTNQAKAAPVIVSPMARRKPTLRLVSSVVSRKLTERTGGLLRFFSTYSMPPVRLIAIGSR